MKKLAITMGDPGGVGAEIIVKAIRSLKVRQVSIPIIIGDSVVMKEALRVLKVPSTLRIIRSPDEAKPLKNSIDCIDIGIIDKFKKNKPRILLVAYVHNNKPRRPRSHH